MSTVFSLDNTGTITDSTWNGSPVLVPFGGTGLTSTTAYGVICGGTTGTAALQALASLGTSGQVLTSQGASALPTWQTVSGTGTVTNVSGTSGQIDVATGTTTPVISIDAGYVGQTSITTLGTIATGTWNGTAVGVAHGGTGDTSFTAYGVICAGTTSTGVFQNVSGLGTTGQVLTSQGASSLPTWQTISGTGTVTNVSGTSGQIDVSNGTSTPVISIDAGYVGQTSITTLGTVTTGIWNATTVDVPHGGTGNTTFTAYSLLCAGTTSTGVFQNVSGVGTTGQVLTSQGASTLPIWQTIPSGTVTSVSGTSGQIDVATGTTTPVISIDAGYVGQSSITTLGTVTTGTWNATTVAVPHGGTGNTTFTAYSILCAGTTGTGTFQNVSGLGSSGQVLTSNGASALPTWQYIPGGTVTSVSGTAGQIDVASGTTMPVISIDAGYVGQTSITTLGTVTTGIWNATTVAVPHGGTGNTTFTAYSLLCAGTTATGTFQNVSGVGTSGQVLTSQGASTLPIWQTIPSGTVTSVSGTSGQIDVASGTTTPVISIDAGYVGQTSITTLGTVTTGTWNGTPITTLGTVTAGIWNATTIAVPHGGTGLTSTTAYGVICAGTTITGNFQNVGTGTTGQVLTSQGASALPTWQTSGSGSGTVTSISSGYGTTGGTITTSGTVALDLSVVNNRQNCNVATIFNLTATYSNGTSGVGATLTNSGTQASLSIDSVSITVGMRVLVNAQTTTSQNGIYTVTNVGSASTNWILTRSIDFNGSITGGISTGIYVWVTSGSLNSSTIWSLTSSGPFTIGTTPIVFTNGIAGLSIATIGGGSTTISPANNNTNSNFVISNPSTGGNLILSAYNEIIIDTEGSGSIIFGSPLASGLSHLDVHTQTIVVSTSTISPAAISFNNSTLGFIGIGAPGGTLQNANYLLPGTFPSSTQTLVCNASGVMSWGGSSSATIGWNYITSQTASSSATLSFNNLFNSTFSQYMIVFNDLMPSVTEVYLYCQLGTGSSPTWVTSTYSTVQIFSAPNGTIASTGSNNSGTNAPITCPNTGNSYNISLPAPYGGVSGYMYLNGTNGSSAIAQASGDVCYTGTLTDGIVNCQISWALPAATYTSIIFAMSSGTIATGTISIYGLQT